uniref:Uncharacterized protein n=1 Tax=Ditylum brightwellii TaxID=49249 RepID=A0A7S4QRW4_9STRA
MHSTLSKILGRIANHILYHAVVSRGMVGVCLTIHSSVISKQKIKVKLYVSTQKCLQIHVSTDRSRNELTKTKNRAGLKNRYLLFFDNFDTPMQERYNSSILQEEYNPSIIQPHGQRCK